MSRLASQLAVSLVVFACGGAPRQHVASPADLPEPETPADAPLAPTRAAEPERALLSLRLEGQTLSWSLSFEHGSERCLSWNGERECSSRTEWSRDIALSDLRGARRAGQAWFVLGAAIAPTLEPMPDVLEIEAPTVQGLEGVESFRELGKRGLVLGEVLSLEGERLTVLSSSFGEPELRPMLQALEERLEAAEELLPLGRPPLVLLERGETAFEASSSTVARWLPSDLASEMTLPENVMLLRRLLRHALGPAEPWLAGGLSRYLAVAITTGRGGREVAIHELERWYMQYRHHPPLESAARARGRGAGVAGALALFCADVGLRSSSDSSLFAVLRQLESVNASTVQEGVAAADEQAGARLEEHLAFRGVMDFEPCLTAVGLRIAARVGPVLGEANIRRILQVSALRAFPPSVQEGRRGLRAGDRIVRIGSTRLYRASELSRALRGVDARDRFDVHFYREGRVRRAWLAMPHLPNELPREVVFYFEPLEGGITRHFPFGR